MLNVACAVRTLARRKRMSSEIPIMSLAIYATGRWKGNE
jgi:hypothetical protein